MRSRPAVSAEGVGKRFGATVALDGVDFDVAFGEIHAVVGENGAGKSTLIRILGGVHRPDRGVICLDGEECHFASPHDAIGAGIVTIPQDLRLVPALSIAENIALGDLPVRRFGPLAMVDRARMREEAREVLAQLDFDPDPRASVASLGFAERQLVAIAKALRTPQPRLHPRRTHCGPRKTRDRALVFGAGAHEAAGHRRHLHFPPSR